MPRRVASVVGMRGFTRVVAATVVIGLALVAAPAAQGGEAQTSTPLGRVEVVVEDATFEVSGCKDVPITMRVSTSSSETSWSADVEARLDGTATTNSAYFYGTGSDFEEGDFLICPNIDGAGRWLVTGEVTMRNYETDQEYTATFATSFVVKKAKTAITISKITASSYYMEITGKVTSRSAQWGTVGVPGSVSVQLRKGRKWVEVGTGYADSKGAFEATVFETYPRKSTFRAVYEGGAATLASTSKAKRY